MPFISCSALEALSRPELRQRKAAPSRDEVRAQCFGHRRQRVSPDTTLMRWPATGFGTPDQKNQRVVLRLSGAGDQVLVGSLKVNARRP